MAGATPTDVPPVRWGLGEAAGGFLAGIFVGAITGQIGAAIVHYRPGHHQPIPLAVTITGLLGLWAGLLGGVIFASRAKGSGDLVLHNLTEGILLVIAILFLFLAVGAPLVEELFFRGLLQRSLARRFGPVVAVGGSAVAFGLAHFEALQLAALILFGLVLGLLADRTGRLGPGIVAHATFNAATVLTLTWGK